MSAQLFCSITIPSVTEVSDPQEPGKTFTSYNINIVHLASGKSSECSRRFHEFREFDRVWAQLYPTISDRVKLPSTFAPIQTKGTIDKRRAKLQEYLVSLAEIKAIQPLIAQFLAVPEDYLCAPRGRKQEDLPDLAIEQWRGMEDAKGLIHGLGREQQKATDTQTHGLVSIEKDGQTYFIPGQAVKKQYSLEEMQVKTNQQRGNTHDASERAKREKEDFLKKNAGIIASLMPGRQLNFAYNVDRAGQSNDRYMGRLHMSVWFRPGTGGTIRPTAQDGFEDVGGGCLVIEVHSGMDLPSYDGITNPYCKLYLLPDPQKISKRKTKSKSRTVNPTWEEVIEYNGIYPSELTHHRLIVSVWDRRTTGKNHCVGEVTIKDMINLPNTPQTKLSRWVELSSWTNLTLDDSAALSVNTMSATNSSDTITRLAIANSPRNYQNATPIVPPNGQNGSNLGQNGSDKPMMPSKPPPKVKKTTTDAGDTVTSPPSTPQPSNVSTTPLAPPSMTPKPSVTPSITPKPSVTPAGGFSLGSFGNNNSNNVTTSSISSPPQRPDNLTAPPPRQIPSAPIPPTPKAADSTEQSSGTGLVSTPIPPVASAIITATPQPKPNPFSAPPPRPTSTQPSVPPTTPKPTLPPVTTPKPTLPPATTTPILPSTSSPPPQPKPTTFSLPPPRPVSNTNTNGINNAPNSNTNATISSLPARPASLQPQSSTTQSSPPSTNAIPSDRPAGGPGGGNLQAMLAARKVEMDTKREMNPTVTKESKSLSTPNTPSSASGGGPPPRAGAGAPQGNAGGGLADAIAARRAKMDSAQSVTTTATTPKPALPPVIVTKSAVSTPAPAPAPFAQKPVFPQAQAQATSPPLPVKTTTPFPPVAPLPPKTATVPPVAPLPPKMAGGGPPPMVPVALQKPTPPLPNSINTGPPPMTPSPTPPIPKSTPTPPEAPKTKPNAFAAANAFAKSSAPASSTPSSPIATVVAPQSGSGAAPVVPRRAAPTPGSTNTNGNTPNSSSVSLAKETHVPTMVVVGSSSPMAPIITQSAVCESRAVPVAPVVAGTRYIVTLDYSPSESDITANQLLPLTVGEFVNVIDRSDTVGWWYGMIGSREGYFPGTYVKPV